MQTLRDSIRSWLKSWDFWDNPFAHWEANQEYWLNRYFVKRSFFDQLLNNHKSSLVFAPRGGGKSATRIMIEAECRPTLANASTLAVSFTDFSPLVEAQVYLKRQTLDDYLPHLITAIMERVLESLAVNPACTSKLTANDVGSIRYWIDTYASHLLKLDFLPGLLKHSDSKLAESVALDLASQVYNRHPPQKTGSQRLDSLLRCLYALRTEAAIVPSAAMDSPSRILEHFVRLVVTALSRGPTSCDVIYLLVDGVDEYPLTQNDPVASAGLLQPILGNLRFLELPHLVTKFFLPAEQQTAFASGARTDRLDVIHLSWDQGNSGGTDDLRALLRRRIAAFNSRGLTTLAELCHPSIRRSIEDDLLEVACDSPRNLLRLGDLLFSEHCRERPEPGSELIPLEWDRAVERFRATVYEQIDTVGTSQSAVMTPAAFTGIPRVRVDVRSKRVYRGAEEVDFAAADLEYRLIEYLYRRRGEICTKDEIGLAVYEPKYARRAGESISGISNQAIDRLFNRLRQRLEPNPSQPVYVITLKGRGYRLENIIAEN